MTKRGLLSATVVASGLSVLAPALLSAHHAISAFDRSRTVTVTGTVIQWQFINPHAGLWLEAVDESGNVVEWTAEFQGTLDLYRHFSWNKDTFKPGDTVTVTGFPAHNGSTNLASRIVVFADGTEVDLRSAPD